MKLNLSAIGKMYIVSALLENARTCLYGNIVSTTIDVQYRQSESDGESHRTSFTMDPMEFFFNTGHVTNIHIYYIK